MEISNNMGIWQLANKTEDVYLNIKLTIMSEQQNQINIEISEEVAEGQYANLAIITHSHAEFVVDFVSVMPGTPKSKVKSRIILTPQHAKRLLNALADNINKFEDINGVIKDFEEVQIPFQFGGPQAQA
jgi:3-deoxy-D-manno-octulosonic-acid transferase